MDFSKFLKAFLALTLALTTGIAPADPSVADPDYDVTLINIYSNPNAGVGDANRNMLGEVYHEITDEPGLAVTGAVSAADVALFQRAMSKGKEAHAEALKQMRVKRTFFNYADKKVTDLETELDKGDKKIIRTLDPAEVAAKDSTVLSDAKAQAQAGVHKSPVGAPQKVVAYISEPLEAGADGQPRGPVMIEIDGTNADGPAMGVRKIEGTVDEVFKALDDVDYTKVDKVYVEWKSYGPLNLDVAERLHTAQAQRESQAGKYRDAKSAYAKKNRWRRVQRFFRNSGIGVIAVVIGIGIFRTQSVQDWLMGLRNMDTVCNSPELMELKARGVTEESLVHAREIGKDVDPDEVFASHEAALEDFCNQINESI